jgi:P4 family phage/plasmid primase-like protien
VDLDTHDAIAKADKFLPPTGGVEGRASKPRSHWWYFVTGVPDWAISKAQQAAVAAKSAGKGSGPFKKGFNRTGADGKPERVIDFQGTGGQAVVPPSVHEGSGEPREWAAGCSHKRIACVPFKTLWDSVCKLAKACGAKVPSVAPVASSEGGATASDDKPEPDEDVRAEETADTSPHTRVGSKPRVDHPRIDVLMPERVARCERYLAKVGLARSGHGGHDTTYRVARLIVNDFAIEDRAKALKLMRAYNDRLRAGGQDVWSERELEHKIDGALAASPDAAHPLGCKLNTSADAPPRAWDDPAQLAEEFLACHELRFVKSTAFNYNDQHYHVVSEEYLNSLLWMDLERAAQREHTVQTALRDEQLAEIRARATSPISGNSPTEFAERKRAQREQKTVERRRVVTPKVTKTLLHNTLAAVRARKCLPDATDLDTWIDDKVGPSVLSVENGLLDPVARTLTPHTASWFSITVLPVRYDEAASPPKEWLEFLDTVMEEDTERIAVMQELLGACLDRSYAGKFFVALVGSGDNGKSVALLVLRTLLGDGNCSAVNLDELVTNRFATFSLFGKLANVTGDQVHFESADEGRLKTLTGGDLVTFEQKGRDTFSAPNRAKLVFACNTMPTFADKSEAVWNRLVAVPFDYTVPQQKKNPALLTAEHWRGELPGILNWALNGLARLRSQGGFTRSAKCDALKNRARTDSNPARQFLLERCKFTGNNADRTLCTELYQNYVQWCSANGYNRPLASNKFGKEVRSAFPQLSESTPRDGKRFWFGLKLKAEDY